jgi:large subunit ribosomal protein L9
MKVILRQDVDKIGLRGEVVEVARGFARNFLLPRKLAEHATPARVTELEKVNAHRALHEAQSFEQAQEISQRLGQTELRFDVKAGDTGVLFGSVTATDIADTLWEKHKIRVDRKKIELSDPIKRIGRYEIPIELFADVVVPVRTLVIPEGGELPPEIEEEPIAPAEAEPVAAPEDEAVVEEVAELSDEDLEAAIAAAEQPETPAPVEEPVEGEEDVPEDAFDRAVDTATAAGSDEESQDRN